MYKDFISKSVISRTLSYKILIHLLVWNSRYLKNLMIGIDLKCMFFSDHRRARENGGMMTKLATEKSLQRKELWRRLKTGQVFYKPQGNYVPVGFERDSKLLNTK